jgi:hypothetical protein
MEQRHAELHLQAAAALPPAVTKGRGVDRAPWLVHPVKGGRAGAFDPWAVAPQIRIDTPPYHRPEPEDHLPLAQQGDHLIHERAKVHPVSSLLFAMPVDACATLSRHRRQ